MAGWGSNNFEGAIMKWLQGLLAEIEKVTELKDSDTVIEAGQHVLGELPDHLKRLYSYCKIMSVKVRELQKEADETDSRKAAADIRTAAKRIEKRLAIAGSIMWEEIRFEFRDRDQVKPDQSLDIVKGWKVCLQAPCDCLFCRMTRQAADGSK